MENTQSTLIQALVAEEVVRGDRRRKQPVPDKQAQAKSTPPVYDPLQIYLLEIKQYKLLTREEEVRLAIGYKEKRNIQAGSKLVTCNLRLVVKIAMDFQRYWTQNLLDLIQEGNLGLLQAIEKYDPYRGIKFSYYASFWIRAYILKFIMDNWKLVKIGTTQNQRKLFYKLEKEKDRLLIQGIDPKPRLLAERLDVGEEEVVEMDQRLGGWEISLSAPLGDDSKESYGDLLPDMGAGVEEEVSDSMRFSILTGKIKEFRKKLKGRDAYIFDHRIMSDDPMTLQNIANRYAISRERVRQIQEKIIKNINNWLKSEIPNFEDDYADMAGS